MDTREGGVWHSKKMEASRDNNITLYKVMDSYERSGDVGIFVEAVETLVTQMAEIYKGSHVLYTPQELQGTDSDLTRAVSDGLPICKLCGEYGAGLNMMCVSRDKQRRETVVVSRDMFDDLVRGKEALREAESRPEDTVVMTKELWDNLTESKQFLDCLEACGVDNWSGYRHAKEMLREEEESNEE